MKESSLVQNIGLLNKLPKTWFIKDFSDVVSDNSGGNKKLAKTEFLESGDIAIVDQGKELIAGFYDNINFAVKTKPPYIVFGDHTRIFKFVDFPFVMGADGTKVLQPKDNNCNAKYLYYFFLSINIPETGYNRHFKYLKELQIPLPPLEQQKKIAAILDAGDAYRQKTKALIAKYDELTQSLFLDMFGDPVKNEKGFELSSVGIQCNVKGGKRVPKDEKLVSEDTGFPYIKAGNIKSGKVTLKDLEYLLPETRERLKRYTVEKGDVCITVVGANIGDVGIIPDELHLANLTENANKILIKDKNKLNNYYLSKYLQMDFVQKNIGAKIMAVGVPKLALFRIEQIELLIPPMSLQIQYKKRVQVIEKQKAQAQASLEKAEELFASLLQRVFKGEII